MSSSNPSPWPDSAIPDQRCKFEFRGEEVGWGLTGSVSWRDNFGDVSCWRPVWKENRQEGRCIWHANVEEKPANELVKWRSDYPERLDGAKLDGVILGGQLSFRGCGLHGARFRSSNLESADFEGIKAFWAQFPNAYLHEAQFLGANLQSAHFPNALLSDAQFPHADLRNAEFSDASLRNARFPHADLRNAEFPDAELTDAQFPHADLRNAEFPDAYLLEAQFPDADLRNAEFPDADLWGAQFPHADLRNAQFPDAVLSETQFPDAKLAHAQFPDAELWEAQFPGANLRYARFPDAELRYAQFSDADLPGADFPDANIESAQFQDADLRGAEFTDSNATFANFHHANLQGTVLTGADVRGATFTSALLFETVFQDTRINTTTTFYDPDSTFYESITNRPACVYEENENIELDRTDEHVSPASEYLPEGVDRLKAAAWVYRRLESLHSENAISDEAGRLHISKEEAERAQHRENGKYGRWAVKSAVWKLTKHGESAGRVLSWWVGVILVTGLLFPFVGGIKDPDGTKYAISSISELTTLSGLGDVLLNLYFSVITFSTIGYGDLSPASPWTRLLVGFESLAGALLLALLIFVISRQVAR